MLKIKNDNNTMHLTFYYNSRFFDLSMSSQRMKEEFQQLTEFERERIIGLREGEFSYRVIAARMQRNSSTVMRIWKQ